MKLGADNLPYEQVGNQEPVCIADEVPFEIPESWEWVRLQTVSSKEIRRGKSPKYSEHKGIQVFAQKCNVKNGGIDMSLAKYLDIASLAKYPEEEYLQDQDIVVNSTGNGTLGRIGVFTDNDRIDDSIIVPDSHVTVIRVCCSLNKTFLLYALKYYQPILEKQGEGSTNQTELKPAVIANLLIPVPPIQEQNRIVEKLNTAFPLVEHYGMCSKALTNYNESFPDMLKKSILQHAIQGKLVPQDPTDEPASVLLERIRAEKEALIKVGKIKRDKHESVIYRRDNSHYEKLDSVERCIDGEIPFELPELWAWSRLGSLVEVITSGSRDWARYYAEEGALFLRMGNLSKNSFDLRLTSIQHVRLPENAEGKRTALQAGDLLFSITGEVGMLGLIPEAFEPAYINQHTAMIRFLPIIRNKYLPFFLLSDYAQKCYKGNQHGIKNSFRLDSIADILVPIPPANQHERIIACIEAMFIKANCM